VADGDQALAAVRQNPPDTILLDRVIPGVNGDEVARRLKSDPRTKFIPIIMLTGKAEETDQLVGFALGADDYVAKPFSPKVLLARIAALLRTKEALDEQHAQFPVAVNTVELDRTQPRVFIDKSAIPLTTTEYRILASLMAAGGTILDAHQLMRMVFGPDRALDERTLESHVQGLRRKLGPAAGCIQMLTQGEYAFCPPRMPRPSA
jgi:two-component system phosphate regulon response regulator PhoB